MIYGLERFDQYTFGRRVIIQNDHKPIGTILKKPLSQAPRRLQALILRLHRYDMEFEYVEGTKLVIADTLSRAGIRTSSDVDEHQYPGRHTRQNYPGNSRSYEERRWHASTPRGNHGWPDRREDVPHQATPYFDVRDTLKEMRTGWAQTCVIQSPNTIPNVPKP